MSEGGKGERMKEREGGHRGKVDKRRRETKTWAFDSPSAS